MSSRATLTIAALCALGLPVAQAAAALPAESDAEVVPVLRSVSELGDTEATRDVGVGAYPVLSAPDELFYPRPEAVEAARAYASARTGQIAFAVADARGVIAGRDIDRRFESASLIKPMLLVAYLGQLAGELPISERARLDPMIRVSDNASAEEVFRRLRPGALPELASRAGMRAFVVGSDWSAAQVTAADQVRFLLALDELLPPAHRAYARQLLADVIPDHSWGIPSESRPAWVTMFKGGWRPNGEGELVHQAALLERGRRRLAIAVLSDGAPSESYGHETIRGIAERLLAPGLTRPGSARPGVLAPISSLRSYRPPPAIRLRRLGT